MERTFAEIRTTVAELHEQIERFKTLAAERRAAGHHLIAQKQMEFVMDLEKRLVELEAALASSKAS